MIYNDTGKAVKSLVIDGKVIQAAYIVHDGAIRKVYGNDKIYYGWYERDDTTPSYDGMESIFASYDFGPLFLYPPENRPNFDPNTPSFRGAYIYMYIPKNMTGNLEVHVNGVICTPKKAGETDIDGKPYIGYCYGGKQNFAVKIEGKYAKYKLQSTRGVNLADAIVPNDLQDVYPTHYAKYGYGGYRSVQNADAMRNIPQERLEEGCMCYVVETGMEYRWNGSEWKAAPRGEQTDYNNLLDRIVALEKRGVADKHAETAYEYNTPNREWVCQHNLGKKPAVTVVDSSGNTILCDVRYVDENNIAVKFGMNATGRIILN